MDENPTSGLCTLIRKHRHQRHIRVDRLFDKCLAGRIRQNNACVHKRPHQRQFRGTRTSY
jgi:hypothetical protein